MTDSGMIDWLIREHQSELLRYATMLLHDEDMAQDAVQHGFMMLVKQPEKTIIANPRAWLYKCVRNFCFNQLKKNKKRILVAEIPETPELTADPAEDARVKEDAFFAVRQALTFLTPLRREIVTLRYRENLSYRQIAEVTGLSVSHVGVTLHEALQILRDQTRKEPIK